MQSLVKVLYKLIMYMSHEQRVRSLASETQRRELQGLIRAFAIERAEAAHQLARQKMECYFLAKQWEERRRARQKNVMLDGEN